MKEVVALLLDETYIQEETSCQDGEIVGEDEDGNLYKAVMIVMIVVVRTSFPFVVPVQEIIINGTWLKYLIDETTTSLHGKCFNVRLVVSSNHSAMHYPSFIAISFRYAQHHTKPSIKSFFFFLIVFIC